MTNPSTSKVWAAFNRFLRLGWGQERSACSLTGTNAECPDESSNLLAELTNLSKARLGFFPSASRRAVEYPWFAERLMHCARKRILDVGAGVNVLPLWLANRGAKVITVDFHPRVRDPSNKNNWNEWGYLDYGLLDPRVKSHNVSITDFQSRDGFDYIYSVSVVEHMGRAVRVQAIARMASLLKANALMLLSVDLIPETDLLWNMSEGQIVDDLEAHGSLDDLRVEMEDARLTITELDVRRGIKDSRTDIAFLIARPRAAAAR
jgi:hypothetical protein